jgi:hypothetical protein
MKAPTTIKGNKSIDISSLPTFHTVLFVNDHKANLLSISQFCDENHSMQFSKDECNIYNRAGKWIMNGTRILDNYYEVVIR